MATKVANPQSIFTNVRDFTAPKSASFSVETFLKNYTYQVTLATGNVTITLPSPSLCFGLCAQVLVTAAGNDLVFSGSGSWINTHGVDQVKATTQLTYTPAVGMTFDLTCDGQSWNVYSTASLKTESVALAAGSNTLLVKNSGKFHTVSCLEASTLVFPAPTVDARFVVTVKTGTAGLLLTAPSSGGIKGVKCYVAGGAYTSAAISIAASGSATVITTTKVGDRLKASSDGTNWYVQIFSSVA